MAPHAVTNLVRRVSIEAKAINPRIKISAALIPWGVPPTGEKDFSDVAPMQRVFQNWHQWMRDGFIDLAVPMNYATETDERVRGWFDGWIRWEKRHKHGRQLAIGVGAYRNTPEHTLAQVARARRADGRARADGVSFYSYASPRAAASTAGAATDGYSFLVDGIDSAPGVFSGRAAVPAMPWIARPERGWIAGVVSASDPRDADGVTVKVRRAGFPLFRRTRTVRTDGNGYYGITNLKPGRYHVWVDGWSQPHVTVTVEAGKVTRAAIGCQPPAPTCR